MKKLLTLTALSAISAAAVTPANAEDCPCLLDGFGATEMTVYGHCVLAGSHSFEYIASCTGKPEPMMEKMVDSDGDGIADDKDRCPSTVAGARVDGNGCEFDSDNDGVLDSADRCPSTIGGAQVDAFGCAVDGDADGDGVADSKDRCPGTVAGASVNAFGCAVDRDDDNDGISNQMDACPGTAAGTTVDLRGCELQEDLSLESVVFSTGTADLSGASIATLNNIARIMRENPNLEFEVGGHTDDRGDYQFNLNLSEQRAQAVRNYLVDQGIDANRLTARGYGPDRPQVNNDSAANRQKNRRVELTPQ